MSKTFNRDELKMLMVVSDLLCKGEVETRIAKYMHEKKWDARRVQKFLTKCLLPREWYNRIWIAYRDYSGCDSARNLGFGLKQSIILETCT